MNESNINHQNIGAALDAVKERHSRGELVGDHSISLTSALRQRLPDLRELNKNGWLQPAMRRQPSTGRPVTASGCLSCWGRWVPGRRLAGDDDAQGQSLSLRGMGIQRFTLYRYR